MRGKLRSQNSSLEKREKTASRVAPHLPKLNIMHRCESQEKRRHFGEIPKMRISEGRLGKEAESVADSSSLVSFHARIALVPAESSDGSPPTGGSEIKSQIQRSPSNPTCGAHYN